MKNVSQQLGWFMVRVLWLSNKTSQVKYDINTFTTHIERTKKIFARLGENFLLHSLVQKQKYFFWSKKSNLLEENLMIQNKADRDIAESSAVYSSIKFHFKA